MTRADIFAGLGWRHAAVPLAVLCVSALAISAVLGPGPVLAAIGQALIACFLIAVLWSALVPFALVGKAWRNADAALAVLFLFAVNILILSLPRIGPFAGLDWNWQGKTLDFVWCLGVVALLSPHLRREIGWTWETHPKTLPVAFINIGLLVMAGFFVIGPSGALTVERVLFDTTHPNLVEEIVFRGFMLALLDRAFPPRWTVSGARIGWGVVLTAWLFGLAHGIAIGPEGGLVFDPVWLATAFVAGLVFGWLRALTGSLWPAFLAHCAPEIGVLLALALR